MSNMGVLVLGEVIALFFVRFLVLALLVAYSYAMGTERVPLNAFGTFVAASFFFVAPALYLLPTYEAWRNKHPNLTSIALVNIFLGWSILGWVIAVAWAFKKAEPVAVAMAQTLPTPSPSHVPLPATATPTAAAAPVVSVADELRKLVELRDQGVLNEDEFQSQKKAILG